MRRSEESMDDDLFEVLAFLIYFDEPSRYTAQGYRAALDAALRRRFVSRSGDLWSVTSVGKEAFTREASRRATWRVQGAWR